MSLPQPDAPLPETFAAPSDDPLLRALSRRDTLQRVGRVAEAYGTLVRATGVRAAIGELCLLEQPDNDFCLPAEVVGVSQHQTLLTPLGPLEGISTATTVTATGKQATAPAGMSLLGRVIDAHGDPLDGLGALEHVERVPLYAASPNPLSRQVIDQAMPTGVRAIDAALTIGRGQRTGIFAVAGGGKSTLLGMLARGAQCDINVIALIGERGREVREFVELILGEQGMARSVVVCATSDRSSSERAKAAYVATAIAEHFRDEGKRVLLMMDSLTRFARAGREIGLAAGEPPARRGFPPSVFAELPRLLERAGMGERGSITALYTVLAEDESGSDPIAEEVRGVLDGHLILSREIAAQNRYPAIDVLGSLSRVMSQVMPREFMASSARLRKLLAKHREVDMLLQIGEYQPGTNALADEAIAKIDALKAFLSQPTDAYADPAETEAALHELAQGDAQ